MHVKLHVLAAMILLVDDAVDDVRKAGDDLKK